MDFQILSILEPPELEVVQRELARSAFKDGKLTAHGTAREVKNNLQVERTGSAPTGIDQIILAALRRNAEFQAFAIPKRILLPLFSRYDQGMEYGAHVDAAIVGQGGEPMRSDLALTLFLSPPESYVGGELVIESAGGEEGIKLPAGDAILYSARTVHRVTPVESGSRLVAVTWVQSAVRDERLRSIVYSLNLAMRELQAGGKPTVLIAQSYNNLLRLSADL